MTRTKTAISASLILIACASPNLVEPCGDLATVVLTNVYQESTGSIADVNVDGGLMKLRADAGIGGRNASNGKIIQTLVSRDLLKQVLDKPDSYVVRVYPDGTCAIVSRQLAATDPPLEIVVTPASGDSPLRVQCQATLTSSGGDVPKISWFVDGAQKGNGPIAVIEVSEVGNHEIAALVEIGGEKYEKRTGVVVNGPEQIVAVDCFVRTARDDKECGGWRIRLGHGSNVFFDKTWGYGQNWDNHSEHRFTEVLSVPLQGEPLQVTSSIEERPGEVRIDWGIDEMRIVLRTNRGNVVNFGRSNFVHKSRGDGGNLKNLDIPIR